MRLRLVLSSATLLWALPLMSQSGANPPRWQVQYTKIYSQGPTVGPGSGLLLSANTSVVTDPALMLGNGPSIRLDATATPGATSISTDPAVWPLGPNTTYIVELQYRLVANPANNDLLSPFLHPAGSGDPHTTINLPSLYRNSAPTGTFSVGAQTNDSPSYQLTINAPPQVSIIVGGITIYRQDAVQTTSPPPWSNLTTLPFPRLGAMYTHHPDYEAGNLSGGVPAFTFTVDQIEKNLAFADLIVGIANEAQTIGVDSIRRLRQLNPKAAILLNFGGALQNENPVPAPNDGSVSLLYQFQQGIADAWYVRDSRGAYLLAAFDSRSRFPNVTPYCPTVAAQTYDTHLVDWLTGKIFASGLWDGYWSDDLFAVINPHIPTRFDPAALDADFNANGVRDETPAAVSDWMRSGVTGILQGLRDRVGDTELIFGNTGPEPQIALAPWVNGFEQECTNSAWEPPGGSSFDEGAWRRVFDAYRIMQATARRPAVNLFTGCGGAYSNYSGPYVTPTSADIRRQRLVLGTALLDDGFFYYYLGDLFRAPYWFDEAEVDENGIAVHDRRHKGYLGFPLSSAVELANAGATVYQQDFEASSLPSSLSASGSVSVSRDPVEVISGQGSLVLSNPDHTKIGTVTVSTKAGAIQLAPGNTYLIRLDWRVLETLDDSFRVTVCGGGVCVKNFALGSVKGDSGTINLPLTVTSAAGDWNLTFGTYGGGGRIAVDSLRVVQGGAGPWRRDFENGFVLVNPLNQPCTFSATDLAGLRNRTGIRRIKGTEAPEVNNGQLVSGELTLGPFDAIILLADHIASGQHRLATGPPGGQPVIRRP